MIFTLHSEYIPDWVKDRIMMKCPYCGSLIADNSDGPTGITARWCPNKSCPGHMQHKMDYIAKVLGVKNFGPATAMTYIKTHHCTSHIEILDEWLGDSKPLFKLSDIADLACIEGYSAVTGRKELNEFASFEDYFHNANPINPILWANRELLFGIEKYFTVAEPMSKRKILVMGHGSFNNFSSRKEFFDEVNEAFGSFIQVIEVGKRKTGVSYMIIDNGTPHTGLKYNAAVESGVPIVTPAEFVNILNQYVHT